MKYKIIDGMVWCDITENWMYFDEWIELQASELQIKIPYKNYLLLDICGGFADLN